MKSSSKEGVSKSGIHVKENKLTQVQAEEQWVDQMADGFSAPQGSLHTSASCQTLHWKKKQAWPHTCMHTVIKTHSWMHRPFIWTHTKKHLSIPKHKLLN